MYALLIAAVGTIAVLPTATGYTQTQIDTSIGNISVISDTANITVGSPSAKLADAINVYNGA